jgi:pyruvate formate lyase activating enzyme
LPLSNINNTLFWRQEVLRLHEALFYDSLPNQLVHCRLCPHSCTIREGSRGECGVRENADGKLFSINYGMLTSISADPVEKKPFRRFMPGTQTYSCGSFGCNLMCLHCQNFSISRGRPGAIEVPPEAFVRMAQEEGCPSVAFTYNEPTVFYEWMLAAAVAAKYAGLATIMVTNGYIQAEPLEKLLPHIDAMNIDLKAFTDEGYAKVGGTLEPVKHAIERSAQSGHVEVTMLLVPGIIDTVEEVENAAEWLAGISDELPLHLSRCFPAFRHTAPPTPYEFMCKAAAAAEKHLKYVYLGNV